MIPEFIEGAGHLGRNFTRKCRTFPLPAFWMPANYDVPFTWHGNIGRRWFGFVTMHAVIDGQTYRWTYKSSIPISIAHSVCPSVPPSHACFVTKRKNILPIFWYYMKEHSSFLTPTTVGALCPLLPKICSRSDPLLKIADFRSISVYNVWTVGASEKSSIIANRKSTTRFSIS